MIISIRYEYLISYNCMQIINIEYLISYKSVETRDYY